MKIELHHIHQQRIAECLAEDLVIGNAQQGLDLLGNLYYQNVDAIILHEHNVTPDFFDLKNGMAGEVLQKFVNYKMRLALVGDFSHYAGKSIRDFMYESNKSDHVCFVSSVEEALKKLTADQSH